jgi:hypothetical protein
LSEEFLQLRPVLLLRLLLNGWNKIIIELFCNCIEPLPIVGERLENDGVSVPADSNLAALEAKTFRKANRLRSAGPKYLGCFHRDIARICISNLTFPARDGLNEGGEARTEDTVGTEWPNAS